MPQLTSDGDLQQRAAFDDRSFYAADLDYVHSIFTRLRHEDPVLWYERGQFWILSKYEDQRYVLGNPELFANGYGAEVPDSFDPEVVAPQLPAWAQEALAAGGRDRAETRAFIAYARSSMGRQGARFLPMLDPPDHVRLRKVLTDIVPPSFMRGLGPRIEEITADVLAAVEPGSTHDLITEVAQRIPTRLITELTAIPAEQQDEIIGYTKVFMESIDLDPVSEPEKAARVAAAFNLFLARVEELLEDRRQNPGSDLISRLAHAEIDDQPLEHIDALVHVVTVLVGSIDTTTMLLGYIGQALGERPDQRRLLREQPEYIPNAVEEVLRYYPIAWNDCRTSTERVEIRGRTIEKGDYLVLSLASANRDEDVWERSQEFDVTRPPVGHQAFGGGPHTCVGAPLARLEARIFLRQMLERFPNWELVGDPVRCISMIVTGLEHLQVRFVT